jgi:diguanylate cyclase (GGDEF)-like protein/PAS domain S-box-containing protein
MTSVLILALAYFVTGWLGLQLPYAGSHITLVWLPTGIAVAALLRWGWAVWPGVFLGALLVNLSVGSSLPLAAGIAAGNTLAPLLTAGWLKHVGFLPAFERQRDIGSFVLAAGMGMVVSASGGCANLYVAGLMPGEAVGSAWLAWWMGDTVGVLLAAPLLLTLSRDSIEQLRLARKELLAWVLVAGLVAWFAFLHDFEQHGGGLPLAFLPLPMLVWAALRFGSTGAAIAGLGFSMVAAWSTARGHGPFVLADVHASLSLLWSYMATIVLMGLLIIALQAERQRVESSLRESELKLRTIIDIEPECVKMLDSDGNLLQMNRAGLDMVEADSADQVVGGKIAGLILAPYRSAFSALTQRVFQGESGSVEFEIRGLKGTHRWLDSHVVPMRNVHGVVTAALGVTRDVTDRKLAEIELRLSEQRFSTAFSSCPVAASIAAAEDGRFIEANDNYERDFGWPRSELIGRTSVEVGIWPDQATRTPWVEAIRREGRLVNYETVWMHKNGERRNVSLSAEITELNGKTCILAYSTDITARKRAEQALVSSETRLRAVLNGVQSGVVTITENGIVESFNQSAEKMFGYGAAEVVGRNVSMLMPEPYKAAHDGYLGNYLSTGIQKVIGQSRNVVARRKDGTTFPIELGVTETFLNETRFFIGSVSDISFRRKAEAELRIAATAFESQEGMVVTDPAGVILRINKAFTDISGYTAAEVVGQTPRLLKSGRHDAAFYAAMWASIASTGAWQGEVWDRRKNGEVYPKWLTISAVKGDDGVVTHYVGTHQDITERKKAEERIKELAFFDSLTHLPNRTLLLDRLKQAMTAGNRSGTFGAVLFIDLDHFKTLNDTLGHDKGDLLLQQVAQRLAASVREGDTVARLGGDEFVVVLGSLNKTAEEAANETEVVGEKILAVLNQTYPLGDIDYRSSASIGATLFRGHETSIEDLLKQADLAMYKSKTSGRNGLHFFDPAMQTVVVERVALETGLRKAIEGNQLLLHFQPQVVGVGCVMGAEALVRWQHPERGMVSPAEFIPLAEETGLILPLGQWVLERACAQLALWAIHPDMAHLTVAVNVSAQEFRDADFVLKVVAILNQTGANPNRLKLELTESLLVDNVEDVIDKMSALKARGVGFSLDDFGTGYSSLSYLKRLPLDQLKIDQSFVRDILIDPNDAAIARTIVALAQSLGLDVIAEGVETETQRAFLASSGCHAYQGYFFSRPLPVAGFEEFVRRV